MTKNILSLCIFLIVIGCDKDDISSLQADSFVKYYNARQVFTGDDVKQLSDNGYAILGTVETLTEGTQICLVRTDKYGNSVDSATYYGRSLDDKAYCLQVLPDGFAILGSSENPGTGNLEVYFIRTNLGGDTLWTRTIGRKDEDVEAYHFEVGNDGSFIMAGYTNVSAMGKEIWLFAIDENGNDFWPLQRIYGSFQDEEGLHLQILSNGYIVITGHTKSYPLGTLTKNTYILITNSTGMLVSFEPINSSFNEEGNCIRVLDDNQYLVIGTMISDLTDRGSDIILRKIRMSSFTVDEILWAKSYYTSGNDIGKSVLVDGSNYVMLGTTTAAGASTLISLIKTDQNGDDPVYFDFGMDSQLTATSFTKTSDNGFIITGTNKHSDNHSSATLIKTKPDGSL